MRALFPLLLFGVAGCGSSDAENAADASRAAPFVLAKPLPAPVEPEEPSAPAPHWPSNFPAPAGGFEREPQERRTMRVYSAVYSESRSVLEERLLTELEREGWTHSPAVDGFDGRRWVVRRQTAELIASLIPDPEGTRLMVFERVRGIGESPLPTE